jgi:hypothetical protein
MNLTKPKFTITPILFGIMIINRLGWLNEIDDIIFIGFHIGLTVFLLFKVYYLIRITKFNFNYLNTLGIISLSSISLTFKYYIDECSNLRAIITILSYSIILVFFILKLLNIENTKNKS